MNLTNLTIKQARQGLVNKDFSALELAKAHLKQIKEKDKNIGAFLMLDEKGALATAKKVDEMIAHKQNLPALAGIPVAIKDAILVKGLKCTGGSKILANYTAPYDATVTKKLKDQSAIILGKTNLDEFAMGSSGENSGFFPTKNPRDLKRVPGGSSSGSGASVAADMSIAALGSDTGGSIRLPASFCGVVGLKPTYGAVSRYGLMAMASSLDQIGLIAKTVADAQIMFDVISGKDELDSTSISAKCKAQSAKPQLKVKSLKDLKIGVPKEYFVKGMDKTVEKTIKNLILKIGERGAKIIDISLPHTKYAISCYYLIMACEVSANMARYDGIKYGVSQPGKDLIGVYLKSRQKGLGKEVRRRIMLGTYALSAGYYDAYYLTAQQIRTLIKQDFDRAFKKADVILTPVAPTPAFKLGEKTLNPLKMYLSDIFTVTINLAGLPAISVPAGEINGLPIGAQIIGKPFDEATILAVGEEIEKITSEHV